MPEPLCWHHKSPVNEHVFFPNQQLCVWPDGNLAHRELRGVNLEFSCASGWFTPCDYDTMPDWARRCLYLEHREPRKRRDFTGSTGRWERYNWQTYQYEPCDPYQAVADHMIYHILNDGFSIECDWIRLTSDERESNDADTDSM